MSLAALEAIVLAGGRGTRLRSVLRGVPKVLAPVEGRPFLHYVLDDLAAQGIREVVLATGVDAGEVEASAAAHPGGLVIRFSREGEPLGTGGAIARAFEKVRGPRAWVLNGDSVCGARLAGVSAIAAAEPRAGWLVAVEVADASRFGTVEADGTRVVAFHEKRGTREPGLINAGIYLLPRGLEVWTGLGACSVERDLFPRWAAEGRLRVARVAGRFLDIGTPESLGEAASFLRNAR